jgi:hypothetical protein
MGERLRHGRRERHCRKDKGKRARNEAQLNSPGWFGLRRCPRRFYRRPILVDEARLVKAKPVFVVGTPEIRKWKSHARFADISTANDTVACSEAIAYACAQALRTKR